MSPFQSHFRREHQMELNRMTPTTTLARATSAVRHTHPHPHAHLHACTRVHALTHPHPPTHTHPHTHMQTHTPPTHKHHSHTQTHPHNAHAQSPTCTPTNPNTHAHARALAHRRPQSLVDRATRTAHSRTYPRMHPGGQFRVAWDDVTLRHLDVLAGLHAGAPRLAFLGTQTSPRGRRSYVPVPRVARPFGHVRA